MYFQLKIDSGDDHATRYPHSLIEKAYNDAFDLMQRRKGKAKIRDDNGNTVGSVTWDFVEEDGDE